MTFSWNTNPRISVPDRLLIQCWPMSRSNHLTSDRPWALPSKGPSIVSCCDRAVNLQRFSLSLTLKRMTQAVNIMLHYRKKKKKRFLLSVPKICTSERNLKNQADFFYHEIKSTMSPRLCGHTSGAGRALGCPSFEAGLPKTLTCNNIVIVKSLSILTFR